MIFSIKYKNFFDNDKNNNMFPEEDSNTQIPTFIDRKF